MTSGLGALSSCGHPATAEECREIFDRNAAIGLRAEQHVTDPEVMRRRTAEAWAAKGAAWLETCVGVRVTDSAMRCIREAATAEEVDACLY